MSHLTLRFCLRDVFNDQNPRYKGGTAYQCYERNFDACALKRTVCRKMYGKVAGLGQHCTVGVHPPFGQTVGATIVTCVDSV